MEQVTQRRWDNRGMRNGAFMLIISIYAIGFYYIPWIAAAVLAVDLIAVGILARKWRVSTITYVEDEWDDYN
jgi:hypothetical protein